MFISFIIYTFFMSYTPGPNNLLALDGTLRLGLGGMLKFLMGIGLGFLTLSLICLVFSEFMTIYFTSFIFIIKFIGFIYLLYLAYTVFKHHCNDDNFGYAYRLRDGLYLQYMNPKTIVYVLTAVVTYVTTQDMTIFASIIYAITIAFIGFSGAVVWALSGIFFKKMLLKYDTAYKICMSFCLIILAFMMLLE